MQRVHYPVPYCNDPQSRRWSHPHSPVAPQGMRTRHPSKPDSAASHAVSPLPYPPRKPIVNALIANVFLQQRVTLRGPRGRVYDPIDPASTGASQERNFDSFFAELRRRRKLCSSPYLHVDGNCSDGAGDALVNGICADRGREESLSVLSPTADRRREEGPIAVSRESKSAPIVGEDITVAPYSGDTREGAQRRIGHLLRFLPFPFVKKVNFSGLTLKLRRDAGIIGIQHHSRTTPLEWTCPTDLLTRKGRVTHITFRTLIRLSAR